jgi:hypothetical protein
MRFATRFSLLLALLMTACSGLAPEISPPSEIAVAVTAPSETPAPGPSVTPAPSSTPETPTGGKVSYRGVRFNYDLSIASSVRGAIIPALQGSTPEFDIPEHIRFIFDEVGLSNTFNPREPQLLIFPIDDFQLASAQRAAVVLLALNDLLEERPLQLEQQILLMPPVPGTVFFQTHARYLRFEQGEGIRFLTAYTEEPGPITNETLFYTYQGISSDGDYFVSLFFPIETEQLPASFTEILPEDYALYLEDYDSYLAEKIALLEKTPDYDFAPNLALLDALVKSLKLPDASIALPPVNDPERVTDRIRREGKVGLRALWRDLSINSPLFEAPSQLNLELFDMKVNGSQDEYRLLLISDSVNLDWQYLLFRSAGNRWLFVGHVDLNNQVYLPPACRIVHGKDGVWWVLTWLQNAGPGVTHYRETWYSFDQGELRVVLDFPLEGFQISQDNAYNVAYRGDLTAEEDDNTSSLRLVYQLSYSIYGDGENKSAAGEVYTLFETERSVFFSWDRQESRFVRVAEESQLTQDQIDAIFYFPGPDNAFLQFAIEELSALARSGTPLQKRWLAQFLNSLDAGLEVEEIRNTLGG